MSPRDLKRLAVTQTPEKEHRLTLVGKLPKDVPASKTALTHRYNYSKTT